MTDLSEGIRAVEPWANFLSTCSSITHSPNLYSLDDFATQQLPPALAPHAISALSSALETQLERQLLPPFLQALDRCPSASEPTNDEDTDEDPEAASSRLALLDACLGRPLAALAAAVRHQAGLIRGMGVRLSSPPLSAALAAESFLGAATAGVAGGCRGRGLAGRVKLYFSLRLRQLAAARAAEEGVGEGGDMGEGGAPPWSPSSPPPWCAALSDTAAALSDLGLGGIMEQAYSEAIVDFLHRAVSSPSVVSDTATPVLARLRGEIMGVVQGFVSLLPIPPPHRLLWASRADFLLHSALGALRIGQMFDLTADYPDSTPALSDLRACLERTSLAAPLAASLRAALAARLLIPGAETATIIGQYVNTYRSLSLIDPSSLLLSLVDPPIKAYLRERRRDTVRCIVRLATGGEGGEGEAEDSSIPPLLLAPDPSLPQDGPGSAGGGGARGAGGEGVWFESDDASLASLPQWEPLPAEARALVEGEGGGKGVGGDVLSMLVGIYGSRELFVQEYRSVLADRLLGRGGYGADREIRTLELLKLRFGEAPLHVCEVMLKDLADSRRTNAAIHQAGGGAGGERGERGGEVLPLDRLDATIVSHLFWPTPSGDLDSFKLPKGLQDTLDSYGDRYFKSKAPRRLHWRPYLGAVDLSVTVGQTTLDLTVSPVLATLISLFGGRREWTAAELGAEVGLDAGRVRRQMAFWVKQGVVIERPSPAPTGPTYTRCEDSLAAQEDREGDASHEDPLSSAAPPEDDASYQVYGQFILGMLTNFEALPLPRIHNMLKMFMTQPVYDRSERDLASLLQRMVAEDKITCDDAVYRKKRG